MLYFTFYSKLEDAKKALADVSILEKCLHSIAALQSVFSFRNLKLLISASLVTFHPSNL